MPKLLDYFRDQFFTSVLLDIVLLVAVFISLKKRKKFTILKYFPVYIASLLLTSLFQYAVRVLRDFKYTTSSLLGIAEYMDFIFTLIEMLIFSHFYYVLIKNRIAKKLIILFNLLFLFFFIYMAVQDRKFSQGISDESQ